MNALCSRFLTALNNIDSFLRQQLGAGRAEGFEDLVFRYAETQPYVRDRKWELRKYGWLRNAIVHHYRDQETIATPHEETVKRLEAISSYLLNPPTIGSLFNEPVATCGLDTSVVEAAKKMFDASFSQLPVYQGSDFQALLTTDTITRWLAACFDLDGAIIEHTPVQTVLGYAETSDNYVLLKPTNPVGEAVNCFEKAESRGRRLYAILITVDGTNRHPPSGIITPFDMPRLYDAIP